jgi:hypothetical protein
MSDTPLPVSTSAEDIEDEVESETTRLEQEADAILMRDEMHGLGVRPLRQALREDAGQVSTWGRERASRLRGAVEHEPVRASVYALGLGVIIGLLIAR